jgi:aminoglycoside phosphotransferase (APT) family kinase protein
VTLTGTALADGLAQLLARVLNCDEVGIEDLTALSGGASRSTWAFSATTGDGARALILRSSSVDDPNAGMELEAASQRAAAQAGAPVATVLAASDDPAALGMRYMISERLAGETIPRRILRASSLADRAALLDDCAVALAAVHGSDRASVAGLDNVDQLELWTAQLDALGQPSAAYELGLRWLADNKPAGTAVTLVHGDFRLGNLMVDGGRLTAVLDWELVHAGDPLEDLAWFCIRAWRFGTDDREAGGLGSMEEFVSAYEKASGREVGRDALRWWQVLQTLRWGVMCGIQAHRHLSGYSRSVELAAIGRRVAETEWDLLEMLAARGWQA